MPVQRGPAAAMINDDAVAVAPRVGRHEDGSTARCVYRRTGMDAEINAGMQFAAMQNGVVAVAKARRDAPVDRQAKPAMPGRAGSKSGGVAERRRGYKRGDAFLLRRRAASSIPPIPAPNVSSEPGSGTALGVARNA